MTDDRALHDNLATPQMGKGWGWIMLYGAASVLFGIAALIWPFAATFAVTVVFGWLLIGIGLLSIAAGVFGKAYSGKWYAIGFGILSLVIGIIMFAEPAAGALSLTMLVVVWLAVRGAMELALGFRMKRARWWMLALGALNILLAIYVLVMLPWSSLTLPGYILGISFLFGGASAISAAIDHKRGTSAFAVPG